MSYTPPPGNAIVVIFSETYTPPPGGVIVVDMAVPDESQGTISLIGFDALSFSAPAVRNQQEHIGSPGFDGFLSGSHAIRNQVQPIAVSGINDTTFGSAFVSHWIRNLVATGISGTILGTHEASGGIRLIYSAGINPGAFGTGSATLGVRELRPQWWVDTFYGVAMMGSDRAVLPSGWHDALFGTAVVTDNRHFPAPNPIDALLFGTAFIAYGTRGLRPGPIESGDFDRWTPPRVHNVRQFIAPEYAPGRWIEGSMGDEQVMRVYNRNRVSDLVGNGISPPFRQIPLAHSIQNRARVLSPAGADSVAWGNTLIADSVRSLHPAGWDSFFTDRFSLVYNAASQLLPFGFSNMAFGTASLVNTRRFVTYAGGINELIIGTPFIAPAVRALNQAAYLEPVGGRIGTPMIGYAVRELTPIAPPFGWGGFFGVPVFDVYLAQIRPNQIPPIVGQVPAGAHISNATPQIWPYWNSDSFTIWGANRIYNQHEEYDVQGWIDTFFGLHSVDYRTKTIRATGFDAHRPNLLHQVRNETPDPPGVQYIADTTLGSTWNIPSPVLHANSLYPSSIDAGLFGAATVHNSGILPNGIPPPYYEATGLQVGVPRLSGEQTIRSARVGLTELWGKPDFSPRTIWAPSGATEQARINHPPGMEEPIDTFLDRSNPYRPIFGIPTVELRNRSIAAGSIGDTSTVGAAAVGHRPIIVPIDGARYTRFGIPSVNGGGEINAYSPNDFATYGDAMITHVEPFIRYLDVDGLNQMQFGTAWVANFHREILPIGLDALFVGSHIVQRPPPPAEPLGIQSLIFGGQTFVDYRIRSIAAQGDDLLAIDWEIGYFELRMRVSGAFGSSTPLIVTAGDQALFGSATISTANRDIAPLSILPPTGQIPVPRVRVQNIVNVPGSGPFSEFGEAWALPVTPGTIQPRGDNFAELGDVDLNIQVFLAGILGSMGEARIANHVGGIGFNSAQFGSPALLGFGCGTRVRAMTGWESLVFGAVGVFPASEGGGG